MSDPLPIPITGTDQLIKAGFRRVGAWRRDELTGSIQFVGATPLPREAGVYAYAVGGVVKYVGSAQRGLRKRLRHYEISKTLKTAMGIREKVLAVLADGADVEVFTVIPPPATFNGLPVDMVLGLEAGLIRSWRPVWNRRGIGRKSDVQAPGRSGKTEHIIEGTPAIPIQITHTFGRADTGGEAPAKNRTQRGHNLNTLSGV
jgi:hypothetical protein